MLDLSKKKNTELFLTIEAQHIYEQNNFVPMSSLNKITAYFCCHFFISTMMRGHETSSETSIISDTLCFHFRSQRIL